MPPGTRDAASACADTIKRYVCANVSTVSATAIALNALAAVNPVASSTASAAANVLTALVATCSSGGKLSGQDVAQLCGALNTLKPVVGMLPTDAQTALAGMASCCATATPGATDNLPWWLDLLSKLPGTTGTGFPGPGGLPIPWSLPGTTPGPGPALPPGSAPPQALPPGSPPPPGVTTADWNKWLAQYYPYANTSTPPAGVSKSDWEKWLQQYFPYGMGTPDPGWTAAGGNGSGGAVDPRAGYGSGGSQLAGQPEGDDSVNVAPGVADDGGKAEGKEVGSAVGGTVVGVAANAVCNAYGGAVAGMACGYVGEKIGGAVGGWVGGALASIF